MHAHLEENVKVHLNKVSQCTITLQCKMEQQREHIMALISALTRVALDVQKPLALLIPPPDVKLTDFQMHKKAGDDWFSPPFYSHIGGYKMCLSVDAKGLGGGEDTHVSVFVHLMRGEHDNQLKWPFRGDIAIQLLNRSRDEGHREKTVPFDDKVGDEYAGRVVGQERAAGFGYDQFIAHTELNTESKEYLKNDCLKFQITKVVVKSI